MGQIEINQQFKKALDLLEDSSENVFITGKAGTGKSTFLTYFRKSTKKALVVLAPTGVAALNVQGETIHSFFRFQPNITVEEAEKIAGKIKKNDVYKNIDIVIIDEISMVRGDLLDCVDAFLRKVLKKTKPFGGLQIVFIGDLYQLPPVVTTRDREHFSAVYESPYFFSARVIAGGEFTLNFIELEKVYRQKEAEFIELLNAIRNNSITSEQLETLNSRVNPHCAQEDDSGHVYLTTTNDAAHKVNYHKLSALTTKLFTYTAEVMGDFDGKLAPADKELSLKAGAQVMFLNNNADGLWVNGTIGVVEGIDEQEIMVRTQEGFQVTVEPYKWTLYRYVFEKETKRLYQENIGSFIQYPLNLAWAVTIHKSQGKSFDRVIVDLGRGTFAHGQAYVALSRCRTFSGMVLASPLKKGHIIMDYRVVMFLARFQNTAPEERCSLEEKINKASRFELTGKSRCHK